MEENNNIQNFNNGEINNEPSDTTPEQVDALSQNGEIELDPVLNYAEPSSFSDTVPNDNNFYKPQEPIAPIMPIITDNEYVKLDNNSASKGIKIFAIIIALLVVISGSITGGYLLGKYSNGSLTNSVADLASKPLPEDAMSAAEVFGEVNPSVVGVYVYSKSGATASATGVIYSKDGYVITNDHIYANITSPKFKIFTSEGKSYDATYVAGDTRSDLAVLKIYGGTNLKPATFGNSDEITVGEVVVAIGRPNGASKDSTISEGIISVASTRVSTTTSYTSRLIQTDTALNPGNSGGALCNLYGQVIGITSAKLVGDYEGVCYAIPTTTVKKIVDSLITNKAVKNRARLGISYVEIDAVSSEVLKVPTGLKIGEIDSDSDLYGKSVKQDDIITHINGKQITDDDFVLNIIEDSVPGDTITLTIYSSTKGNSFDVTVKLLADEGSSSYIGGKGDSTEEYTSSQFSFPNGE